jgi:glycerol uptake facilitator-like aquaporin
MIILFFEGVGSFILLYLIFGKKNAKHKKTLFQKAFYISIGLFFVIWVNDTVGAPTLNPARALAPAMVSN